MITDAVNPTPPSLSSRGMWILVYRGLCTCTPRRTVASQGFTSRGPETILGTSQASCLPTISFPFCYLSPSVILTTRLLGHVPPNGCVTLIPHSQCNFFSCVMLTYKSKCSGHCTLAGRARYFTAAATMCGTGSDNSLYR
jgi:hypothetical protein